MFFDLRFWFFFPVFDIINLYISSKRFEGLIFSSNSYKQLFESMNYVCNENLWNRLLSFSFSIFLNKLKKIKGWFGNFFIFKVSFICFSNLSLYSVFAHFCFSKRTCEKKNLESAIANSVLEFIHKFLIIILLFKTLLFMKEILLLSLIDFFKKLHLFLLTFMALKTVKIFRCTNFTFIRAPNKLFKAFLSILMRLYLNYFFSLLSEVCLK